MDDDTRPRQRETMLVISRDKLEAYFLGAAFLVLLALGAIAAMRLYISLEKSILVWLRPQFVPLAQAGFSLAILVVVIWLLRAWVIARAK